MSYSYEEFVEKFLDGRTTIDMLTMDILEKNVKAIDALPLTHITIREKDENKDIAIHRFVKERKVKELKDFFLFHLSNLHDTQKIEGYETMPSVYTRDVNGNNILHLMLDDIETWGDEYILQIAKKYPSMIQIENNCGVTPLDMIDRETEFAQEFISLNPSATKFGVVYASEEADKYTEEKLKIQKEKEEIMKKHIHDITLQKERDLVAEKRKTTEQQKNSEKTKRTILIVAAILTFPTLVVPLIAVYFLFKSYSAQKAKEEAALPTVESLFYGAESQKTLSVSLQSPAP